MRVIIKTKNTKTNERAILYFTIFQRLKQKLKKKLPEGKPWVKKGGEPAGKRQDMHIKRGKNSGGR